MIFLPQNYLDAMQLRFNHYMVNQWFLKLCLKEYFRLITNICIQNIEIMLENVVTIFCSKMHPALPFFEDPSTLLLNL